MNRHAASGRWGLGLFFTLFTVLVWGGLPLILKVMLLSFDAYTMTWYRFIVALVITAVVTGLRGNFSQIRRLKGWYRLIFVAAVISFSSAYVLYPFGLEYISPSAAQVVNQISLFFILVGGVFFFHERLTGLQGIGIGLLVVGILLFFNDRFTELLSGDSTMIPGILWIVVAALALTVYTLTQKQLLEILPTDIILFLIYLAGSFLLLPFVDFQALIDQNSTEFILLNSSAVISLIAFVALVEGMKHLEVNRISMLLATVPLTTVGAMAVFAPLFPNLLQPELLNTTSILGAVLVVIGSMLGNLRKSG